MIDKELDIILEHLLLIHEDIPKAKSQIKALVVKSLGEEKDNPENYDEHYTGYNQLHKKMKQIWG